MADTAVSRRHRWAVIMAGGRGERLWPLSRTVQSKPLLPLLPFLPFLRNRTLLESAWERAARLVPASQIIVVCGTPQADAVRRLLGINGEQLLVEPERRNTAACIGLASCVIHRRDARAVCLVMPSDHLIKGQTAFRRAIEQAFTAAAERRLVAIGITPSTPSSEYGYLKVGRASGENGTAAALAVERFVEKPTAQRAARLLQSGEWLWHSGIVVGSVASILAAIQQHLPRLRNGLRQALAQRSRAVQNGALTRLYRRLPSVSIDCGVWARLRGLLAVRGTFSWHDVGAWDRLEELRPSDASGNRLRGTCLAFDTRRSTIVGDPGRLIAAIGVSDLLVVQAADATLVCPRSKIGALPALMRRIAGDRRLQPYL